MARFEEIADVSFMGNITLAGLKKTAVEEYNAAYKEITGNGAYISDENKAVLYAAAQIFYQLAESVDTKARMNLLKYASGEYLDNLALIRGLTRKKAEKAVVTVRFTLSAARTGTVAIPQGTRVTNSGNHTYFETTEYTEIPPGEMYADVSCISVTGGASANNFSVGELNVIVDPIAYIASVENIEEPTGGTDEETDAALAERIFESRNLYSTTGSENAYIYHAKSYSTLIEDVVVSNPKDAEIYIYILMKDRKDATTAFIEGLTTYLCDDDIKPLTDKITVKNVGRVEYSIDAEYTIYEADISRLAEIEAAIKEAVENYQTWQCAKIGRDINYQKLVSLMIAAGAATVNVKSPANATITAEEIASCTSASIEYKGYIED